MHPGGFSTRKPENLASQRARKIFRLKSRSGSGCGGNGLRRRAETTERVASNYFDLSLCLFPWIRAVNREIERRGRGYARKYWTKPGND